MSPKLGEYTASYPKIILAGRTGSGKTLLATTLGARSLVLDLNNGLSSAARFKDAHTATRAQCDVKCCWDAGKPDAVWKRTLSYIQEFERKPMHEALVIDGLSDLAEAAMGSILIGGGKWSEDNASKQTQADWGAAIGLMTRLMYRIKVIKAVVILVAHVRDDELKGKNVERLAVYGKGTLAPLIEGIFDEVWYTNVTGLGDKRKFELQTVSTYTTQCKTRRQLPDGTNMNVGMGKILEMIGWVGVPVAAAGAGGATK